MVVGMANEFDTFAQRAAIKVCGVGGGGGNAVDRMISAGLQDVEFIVINTDAQALKSSPAPRRLQIGLEVTGGLGSGGKPEVGLEAALEDREALTEVLEGADMVFLTAGMGGGTGTGAAPIVAELAKATGALTLGIVTLPFSFEGTGRMDNAIKGMAELEQQVDSLIVIPNERVAALGQTEITFLNAFEQADEVLHNGVRAITNLIQVHGLWNVDFADFRTVMEGGGRALMGIGRAEGERRAVRAAEEAIVCPLLQQSTIDGATGIIVNIRGGRDIGMRELEESVQVVKAAACSDATLFVGAALHDEERPELEVTVIAAGFAAAASDAMEFDRPVVLKTPHAEPDTSQAPDPIEETDRAAASPFADLTDLEPGHQAEFFPEDGGAQPVPVSSKGGAIVDFDSHEPKDDVSVGDVNDTDISVPTWLRLRRKAHP